MKTNRFNPSLLQAARTYRAAGLCPLPASRRQKRPVIDTWKDYQSRLPEADELDRWFSNGCDAVCLVAGSVSGNLELIDFDLGGQLYAAWSERIPDELLAKLVVETSQSRGTHVIYRCREPICGNLKLARRVIDHAIVTLIETRGDGGLFLCVPTFGYDLIQGSLTCPPVISADERDVLLQAAWDLNEVDDKPFELDPPFATTGSRPGDDFNARGDVRALLQQHSWRPAGQRADGNEHWTRPGKRHGTSATLKDRTFYVFSSNAHPFESNRAYSPFAVYAALEHDGDFECAAGQLATEGFGASEKNDVDLSFILDRLHVGKPIAADPGTIPEELFQVPGFIDRVMDFTLGNAPYPNPALAFCGALALQSFLAGRKVCTPGDLRTNIYLLALASSGTGKEFPRKVNTHILHQVGLASCLGDKFASGEGIQDALVRTGIMLFQNDEMDGVLRQINFDKENRRESIPNVLLTLYTSSSDIYPIRVKAGQKQQVHIDQPHVTLFGTATPQFFYEALSQRMLTNGFFARLCIIDVGKRGTGQAPGAARLIPEPIMDIANWWAEFQPGTGNLQSFHPQPRVVEFAPDAAEAVEHLRQLTEAEYDRAEQARDEVARTAWSRTCEQAKKLALIYACSENHQAPLITLSAVEWATAFAMHQTRRQLFLAGSYVAENPFHGECLKVLRILKESPGNRMQRQHLLRAMRCKAAEFDQIVSTLIQQGDVVAFEMPTATKKAQGYRLP